MRRCTMLPCSRPRSGQARHLHPENQPDTAEADLRHQALKAKPAFDGGTRAAKIVIDHHNGLPRPAEMKGAIDQSVLQPCRLPGTFDLLNRRLPDVDDCQAFTMPPKDFLGQAAERPRHEIPIRHHRLSPRWSSAGRSTRCGSGASPSGPSVRTRPCCRSAGSVSQTGRGNRSLIA